MRCLIALLFLSAIVRADPPPAEPAPPAAIAPPPPAAEPAPKPVWKRPWMWIALGGVAGVLATGIVLGTLYGGPERDPEPTFRAIGN
jgi:hypothetical protein